MRLIESQIKAAKKDRNKLYLSVLQTEVSVMRESTVLLAHQHMYSPESHFGDADSASFRPLNPKTAFTYKSSKKSSITSYNINYSFFNKRFASESAVSN